MTSRYQTVRVGDLDIHYDLADYTVPWRETPPQTFLLYHGYARNMLFWRPWVPLLAADYRVLWFDARGCGETTKPAPGRSEEHTSELQSLRHLVCRLLLEKKKKTQPTKYTDPS